MPDNYKKLEDDIYIVRTQAGFKKAAKETFRSFCDDATTCEIINYPKSYPSLVTFFYNHEFDYLISKCVHLNRIQEN